MAGITGKKWIKKVKLNALEIMEIKDELDRISSNLEFLDSEDKRVKDTQMAIAHIKRILERA